MARLPSRDEIRRSRIREARLAPKRLKAMNINVAKFDSALVRIQDERHLLGLAEQRTDIIRDIFEFWVQVAETRDTRLKSLGPVWGKRPVASEGLAAARTELQQLVRPRSFPRGNPKPRLLKLREKWREADPLGEEHLWGDLLFQLSECGLDFAEWNNRFFVYPYPRPRCLEFLSEPDVIPDASNLQSVVRDRVRAACLATIKDWGLGYRIKRGRRAFIALYEWIVSMAAHYIEAGGKLKDRWASHNGTLECHTSEFAEFIIEFYRILPPECQIVKDEAEVGQRVEEAGQRFQSRKWDDPDFVFCRKPKL